MPRILDDERPLTAAQAAARLRVTPKTVREWIRRGAPVVRSGRPGAPALVRTSELETWRAGGDLMARIGRVLLDTHRREADEGKPAHEALGIDKRKAAVLLACVYERAHSEFRGQPPAGDTQGLPEPVRQLLRIAAGER